MKTIGTIEDCIITEDDSGKVTFMAKAAIDCDGSDNRHNDPCWQADTSLQYKGKAIDSEAVPGIVVPPLIINSVKGTVLGCRAKITNIRNGRSCDCVVFDVGPRRKLGEISPESARRIGLSGNPNHGGSEMRCIRYEIFPGTPAVVDGITYTLKPYRA